MAEGQQKQRSTIAVSVTMAQMFSRLARDAGKRVDDFFEQRYGKQIRSEYKKLLQRELAAADKGEPVG